MTMLCSRGRSPRKHSCCSLSAPGVSIHRLAPPEAHQNGRVLLPPDQLNNFCLIKVAGWLGTPAPVVATVAALGDSEGRLRHQGLAGVRPAKDGFLA